jgi:MoaA/NifB/PqqE/SkfB family radical SAM enzyme
MEMFYKNNKVRRLHLPTNGYATKKIINDTTRMLNELPKLEINIGVSIDALYEKHDSISKKTGAFTKAIETQRILIDLEKKHKNLSTKFYTVLSNDNIEDTDKLFEYIVKEFGFEKIGFSPLRGDPANPELKSPTPLEWDKLYNMYKKYVKTKPMDFKQFLINRKMNNLHVMNRKALSSDGYIKGTEKNFGKFSCSAGNNICVIDADGEVRVCELKEPVGNLRNFNYDIRKILNKKQKHNCTCTHACFQNASVDVSPINYIKQFI